MCMLLYVELIPMLHIVEVNDVLLHISADSKYRFAQGNNGGL